jgi:hypothetical protein
MTDITKDINYPKLVWEQLRRWRSVRDPLLAKLDIEVIRALEVDDKKKLKEVADLKAQLRDITDYDFSQVEQLEDILKIWPECLGEIPEEFKV